MVNYRRSQTKGASYFFTVNLKNRKANHLINYIEPLRESFRNIKQQQPFKIEAIVILPDHLHTIWTLPANDANYPARWKAIKSKLTRLLIKEGIKLNKNNKGEYDLWQRRYWEHQIRDNLDLQRHIDYIHYNPVKHGYVSEVKDWPHSSFHRYVENEFLDSDWAGVSGEVALSGFGE